MQLLENLFRLDGNPQIVTANAPVPTIADGQTVKNVVFEVNPWSGSNSSIKRVTFLRVALSKLIIEKVTFSDCKFEDCLFIGTRFRDLEFHNCTFKNCNFWKARFNQVYLDPDTIIYEDRFKKDAANAGISLYHSLLSNFADERQDKFYMFSDINFRRWKRFQIQADLDRNRIGWLNARFHQFTDWLYELCADYGYSPAKFFATTVVVFLAVSCLNYIIIGDAVAIHNVPAGRASLMDTVFYTFSILTVLGFSTIVPDTALAKLLSVSEALLAVCWLGVLTSVLVKRFLR